jgi:processive 1,2-diacylglycerol beta-glucosyltransferase
MEPRKRLAVLTLRAGSGEARAAHVVLHALGDGDGPLEPRLFDATELARPWFRWFYGQPWRWVGRRFPRFEIWRARRGEQRRISSTAPRWFFRRGCREVFRQLKDFSPHLVIATEVGAAEVASLARREGWVSSPILAVQTRFSAEPAWVQREIDMYCVGNEESRSRLIAWGVSPNRVVFTGLPIDPAYALAFDKEELLQALGLDGRRPVVLVVAGGPDRLPVEPVLQSLELCGMALQVLVVTGHNEILRQNLEALRGRLALDLHTFGWTENLPELMAAADLMIARPGAEVTAEALAARLPMVFPSPAPGTEERHARSLERSGAAVCARDFREISQIVHRLLEDRRRLNEMAQQAHELARPDAVHAIAQVARALLEKASYMDLLAAPQTRPGDSAYLM